MLNLYLPRVPRPHVRVYQHKRRQQRRRLGHSTRAHSPDRYHEQVPHSRYDLFSHSSGMAEYHSHDDTRTSAAMMLAGIPFLRKSTLVRYTCPRSSSCAALAIQYVCYVSASNQRQRNKNSTHASWFGKPETGMPIPVEHIKPVRKISRLA
jgi:hypothetical protein